MSVARFYSCFFFFFFVVIFNRSRVFDVSRNIALRSELVEKGNNDVMAEMTGVRNKSSGKA